MAGGRFISVEERKRRILVVMKIRGVSLYRIAKDTGINYSQLQKSVNNGMSLPTLVKIANYLGVSGGYLIDRDVPSVKKRKQKEAGTDGK